LHVVPNLRRGVIGTTGVLVIIAALVTLVLHHRFAAAPAPASPSVVAPSVARGALSASVRRHLSLSQEYRQKFWCSDAIEELKRALAEEPQLRADPEIVRAALPCLRAKAQAKTIEFLVTDVGVAGRPELQAALASELKPDVREGVQRVLARLAGAPP
jgi:hypothetical protein